MEFEQVFSPAVIRDYLKERKEPALMQKKSYYC